MLVVVAMYRYRTKERELLEVLTRWLKSTQW